MPSFKAKTIAWTLIIFSIQSAICQLPTNTFRTHFDYTSAKGVTVSKNCIYVNSTNGFFRKKKGTSEVQLLDKRNKLSTMNVTATCYRSIDNQLLIGYKNGIIDVITLNNEDGFSDVNTIDFIEKSTAIQTSKSINKIVSIANKAYAVTDFGLVEINLETRNISETYRNIGPGGTAVTISDVKIRSDSIYVNTSAGILGGRLSPNVNLLFFGNWKLIENSTLFNPPNLPPNAQLITTANAVISEGNTFWVADNKNGLVTNENGTWQSIIPEGLPEVNGYFVRKNDRIGFIGIRGFEFDRDLWQEIPLPYPAKINSILDRFGNEWVIQNGNLRVTSNGRTFNFSQFNGLSGRPTDIALDRDDLLWISTTNGVTVIPTITDLANNPVQPFTPVFKNQRLLLQQIVNTVEIDGGNRKWFGTNSGLSCFSADTDKLINFFDTKNSLLPDNHIMDLAINQTGELFILSQNGVISYQTDAAEPEESLNNVTLFPNPIRPDFDGVFTVKGLSFDSKIKITTPDGRVISTTFSNGGIATWDLRTPNGEKAPSGVYLVFVLNDGLTEKFVGKVALVR